jgi:ParB/RepB/Spo0J family partition protein
MLFDRKPLLALKESINKVGILVPITTYRGRGADQYTILDGQRRWICAKELGLTEVPINEVAEPDVAQNIVTMFQIHKLRKDWELMPTALKLEVLMDELQEKRDKALAELTGLNPAVVVRCKKLLTYDQQYRDMMTFVEPTDRIKADFFIELYPILTDRVLALRTKVAKNRVTDIMLRKYQNKLSGFKSLTDFRKIKAFISIAKNAGKEKEMRVLFEEFLNSDKMQISELEIDAARVQREAKQLTRKTQQLQISIRSIKASEYLGQEEFWKGLESLLRAIESKIREAGRRID